MGILPGFGGAGIRSSLAAAPKLVTPSFYASDFLNGVSSSSSTISLSLTGITTGLDSNALIVGVVIHEGLAALHTWPSPWTKIYPTGSTTGNYSLATRLWDGVATSVNVSLSAARTYRGGFVWGFNDIQSPQVFSNYIGQNTATSSNNLGSLSANAGDVGQGLEFLAIAIGFDYNNTDPDFTTVSAYGNFVSPDVQDILTSGGSVADYRAYCLAKAYVADSISDGPTFAKAGTNIPIFAWQALLLPQNYTR